MGTYRQRQKYQTSENYHKKIILKRDAQNREILRGISRICVHFYDKYLKNWKLRLYTIVEGVESLLYNQISKTILGNYKVCTEIRRKIAQ